MRMVGVELVRPEAAFEVAKTVEEVEHQLPLKFAHCYLVFLMQHVKKQRNCHLHEPRKRLEPRESWGSECERRREQHSIASVDRAVRSRIEGLRLSRSCERLLSKLWGILLAQYHKITKPTLISYKLQTGASKLNSIGCGGSALACSSALILV